ALERIRPFMSLCQYISRLRILACFLYCRFVEFRESRGPAMSNESPLFRHAALEAKRTSALGEIVLVQPLSFIAGTAAAAAVGAVIVGFFVWGTYTKHTTLGGQLVPNLGVIEVHAQQPGTIIEKHVAEGDAVSRGDTL